MKVSAVIVLVAALQCALALPLAPVSMPGYPYPIEAAYPPFVGYPSYGPYPGYPYLPIDLPYPGLPAVAIEEAPVVVETCNRPVIVEPACGCAAPPAVVVEPPPAVVYEAPRRFPAPVVVEEVCPCSNPEMTVLEEKSNNSPNAVASAQNFVNVGPQALPRGPCQPCADPVVVVDPTPCDNPVVVQNPYAGYFAGYPYYPRQF